MDTPTTPPIDLGAIEARLNAATVYRHAHSQTAAYDLVKRARREGRTGMRIRVNLT